MVAAGRAQAQQSWAAGHGQPEQVAGAHEAHLHSLVPALQAATATALLGASIIKVIVQCHVIRGCSCHYCHHDVGPVVKKRAGRPAHCCPSRPHHCRSCWGRGRRASFFFLFSFEILCLKEFCACSNHPCVSTPNATPLGLLPR